jgi:hypothetical protein
MSSSFFQICRADVGDEKDRTGVAVGARIQRPRSQTPGKLRRQHPDAVAVEDIPDAVDIDWVGHGALRNGEETSRRHPKFRPRTASGKPAKRSYMFPRRSHLERSLGWL